ncbi:sensor histidine kinase [Alteromonas facilis]|uniref:sensor histidine kinase n=1 Tax=Alteromonas facilis TaxID=2048004 RepID=UPI000C28D04F|nr:HAMP domain-containing sensor histidine kinase [Alteromonas facilis]
MRNSLFSLSAATLSGRLKKSIALLTIALFLLFSATTMFVVYSFEDAVYKERLTVALNEYRQNKSLPENVVFTPDLSQYNMNKSIPNLNYEVSESETHGEFSASNRHYHYMAIESGFLVLDITDTPRVSRAIGDITRLLFLVLIPALLLSVWVASITSRHALKPFQQLSKLFTDYQSGTHSNQSVISDIAERDVKQIAEELLVTLEQKAYVMEQQAAFSQSMAHELRTPLQVMTHSLELLEVSNPKVIEAPAYARLRNSVARMKRISSGLLWITSDHTFDGHIDAHTVIESTLQSLDELQRTHKVNTTITSHAPLSLPMPTEVLELMVFNLLQNVIHHGAAHNGSLQWAIDIYDQHLTFSNGVDRSSAPDPHQQGFGIGLTLMEKLAKRFGLAFRVALSEDTFSVTLTIH